MSEKKRRPRGTGGWFTKRSIYWIKFYHGKEAQYESTGKRGKEGEKVARALLKRRLAEIETGKFAPKADKLTLEDLERLVLADYELHGKRSAARIKQSFAHLKEHFGNDPAPSIPRRMREYMADRKREGAGDGTIAAELTAVRRGFTLAAQDGLVAWRPVFPKAPEPGRRTGFIDEGEMAKILVALRAHLRPYVRFLFLTAWRRNEAAGLLWEHVDLDAGEIRLPGTLTKNGVDRLLPFHSDPRLDQIIRDQWARAEEWKAQRGEVVRTVFSRPSKSGAKRIVDFRKSWEDATEAAGKPDLLIHDLRRSRARLWSEAGIAESVSMQLGGWETASVFKRYRIVPTKDMERALEKAAEREAK